jgi:predicted DNA-binding transcriptional regulator YafY
LGVLDVLPERSPGLTVAKLAESGSWGVDPRTLLRDLKTLEKLELAERRAPMRDDLEDCVSERWFRISGNHPRRQRLSAERAIAFDLVERLSRALLPAQVVQALKGDFEEARRRLSVLRNVDPRTRWANKVHVLSDSFTRIPTNIGPDILKSLQGALLTNQQVMARYRARARGVSTKRQLEPRALVQRGPTLFIVATRADKPEPRWYAVHRFLSVRILEARCSATTFVLKEYLETGGADFGASGPPIAFRAWVSKDLKRDLQEAPLAQDMKLKSAKGGGAMVTATVQRSWAFQRWLLSRGPDIQVMEPESLRDYMVRKLTDARGAYP